MNPESLLCERSNDLSFLRFLRDGGLGPISLFGRSSNLSPFNLPQDFGICPVHLLPRSIAVKMFKIRFYSMFTLYSRNYSDTTRFTANSWFKISNPCVLIVAYVRTENFRSK